MRTTKYGKMTNDNQIKMAKLTKELDDIYKGQRKLHTWFGHLILIPSMIMAFIWSALLFIPILLRVIFYDSLKIGYNSTDELAKGLMRSRKKEKKREEEITKEIEDILKQTEEENKDNPHELFKDEGKDNDRSEQTESTAPSS